MASIVLDLVNYQDGDGSFNPQVVHELTEGLSITFDEPEPFIPVKGEYLFSIPIEFTGSRADLVTLIDRYEEDVEMRHGLVNEIVDHV